MTAVLLLTLLACGDKDDGDTGTSAGTTGGDTGNTETTTGPTSCDDGLPTATWQDAPDDDSLYALAADLTIETRDGDIVLSELWNGCDVVLFIQDQPLQADADTWPRHLWERDLDDLFENLPTNTILFFGSNEMGDEAQTEALDMLDDELEDVFDDMDDDDRAWWEARVHVVEGRYRNQDGWLGDQMSSPNFGTMLDRSQQLRYIGSYADQDRYSSSIGWFEPNVSMAANEAVYANFLIEREHRLAGDGADVINVWTDEIMSDTGWAGVRSYATVTLPDAATMATYDSLELDLMMGCGGEGEYGYCPDWDYLVYLYLCDVDDPETDTDESETCSTEFGRWITTYHREGRYVHDVTPLLALIKEGGERRFAFYTTQQYTVSMDMRLSNQGRGERPIWAEYLYSGAAFGVDYNDGFDEKSIEIPSDATRVEVATVISGHGQVSPGTCAEFCSTEHHFYVDGTANTRELDNAGTSQGCMDLVAEGVVPNQYGTWWYGRSGWCPGWEVPVVSLDITDQVTAGSASSFDYEGFRGGEAYETGGANIVMSSWVVAYQ